VKRLTGLHPQFGATYGSGALMEVTKIFLAPDVLLRFQTAVFVSLNAMFDAIEKTTTLPYKPIFFPMSPFGLFSGNYAKNSICASG
jgi:hypothetical protein